MRPTPFGLFIDIVETQPRVPEEGELGRDVLVRRRLCLVTSDRQLEACEERHSRDAEDAPSAVFVVRIPSLGYDSTEGRLYHPAMSSDSRQPARHIERRVFVAAAGDLIAALTDVASPLEKTLLPRVAGQERRSAVKLRRLESAR